MACQIDCLNAQEATGRQKRLAAFLLSGAKRSEGSEKVATMRAKSTWVGVFFVLTTIVVGLVLSYAVEDMFNLMRVRNAELLGENFRLNTLVGFTIAIIAGAYFGVKNQKSRSFVEESAVELDKVAWPDQTETRVSTLIVIVFSFMSAAVLGVFDWAFSWLTNNNFFLY